MFHLRRETMMPQVKFYEEGVRSGDWMAILDRIEKYQEWAIVFNRADRRHDGGSGIYRCFVNGELCGPYYSYQEANEYMQRCMSAGRRL